ncbi:ASCH domain-containing protein [Neobacillus notoginsengisoli]|uniref:ASCH domain-containing protein n=1 Tax=Neobacillus notoginsengisoli TaxID=1578198 RepID=A0A417YPH2_9BACI|nr:ASCH domain-containing protein [Neobacillus notoginsengisoli]RHW35741.1 ASCH domain-containing protein [Neobacillus notoginsengisoli]
MNEAAQMYWNDYWDSKGTERPASVSAWQFGDDPDYLAQLVIDGIKTATCSGYIFYELENERLPAVGDYSIVLNSKDEAVAMIKTVNVKKMPMNEVPEDFAIAEGEGDRTYRYWKEAHVRFFTEELKKLGLEFSEDMMLVCERFELVDVKGR